MKIFLTGGTGYVGNRLALYFAEKGMQVNALVRSKNKSKLLQHKNISLFYGDLTDGDVMVKGMLDCDAIIHSAAYAAVYTKTPELFHTINVKGSQNVFYAAQKSRVRKMIFISSAGVLGPSIDVPVDEAIERTVPYFNEYEATKAEAESWLLNKSSDNLGVVSLNLSRVFGPGQLTEANGGTRLLQQVAKGWRIIPGDGKSIGNYIFIDDILKACELAIEKGKNGHRYIIGGDNLDFNTYFSTAKKYTNASQKMLHVPVSVIMLMSRIMSFMGNFGVKPTITPSWVKRYSYNWILDNDKAQKDLGITFTPFEEGIKQTVDWLKNEKHI